MTTATGFNRVMHIACNAPYIGYGVNGQQRNMREPRRKAGCFASVRLQSLTNVSGERQRLSVGQGERPTQVVHQVGIERNAKGVKDRRVKIIRAAPLL